MTKCKLLYLLVSQDPTAAKLTRTTDLFLFKPAHDSSILFSHLQFGMAFLIPQRRYNHQLCQISVWPIKPTVAKMGDHEFGCNFWSTLHLESSTLALL
jgi:hypothetical protein